MLFAVHANRFSADQHFLGCFFKWRLAGVGFEQLIRLQVGRSKPVFRCANVKSRVNDRVDDSLSLYCRFSVQTGPILQKAPFTCLVSHKRAHMLMLQFRVCLRSRNVWRLNFGRRWLGNSEKRIKTGLLLNVFGTVFFVGCVVWYRYLKKKAA